MVLDCLFSSESRNQVQAGHAGIAAGEPLAIALLDAGKVSEKVIAPRIMALHVTASASAVLAPRAIHGAGVSSDIFTTLTSRSYKCLDMHQHAPRFQFY